MSQPDCVCLCLHIRVREGRDGRRGSERMQCTQFPQVSAAKVDQMFLSLERAARLE